MSLNWRFQRWECIHGNRLHNLNWLAIWEQTWDIETDWVEIHELIISELTDNIMDSDWRYENWLRYMNWLDVWELTRSMRTNWQYGNMGTDWSRGAGTGTDWRYRNWLEVQELTVGTGTDWRYRNWLEVQELTVGTGTDWRYRNWLEVQELTGDTRTDCRYRNWLEVQELTGGTGTDWRYTARSLCPRVQVDADECDSCDGARDGGDEACDGCDDDVEVGREAGGVRGDTTAPGCTPQPDDSASISMQQTVAARTALSTAAVYFTEQHVSFFILSIKIICDPDLSNHY